MHLHHLCNHFNRTFITEAFTRTNIHLIRNGVQRLLALYRQVRALGQVLANQTVNVIIATALPMPPMGTPNIAPAIRYIFL